MRYEAFAFLWGAVALVCGGLSGYALEAARPVAAIASAFCGGFAAACVIGATLAARDRRPS